MSLIVFEGIDGSGKSTQLARLCAHLDGTGREYRRLAFPRYGEPSSALIRMYLGGAFGPDPGAVNPWAASAFYAVDRFASYATDWGEWHRAGKTLLADRYTTSNAIHQGAKLPGGERGGFCRWLGDFEYDKLGLPAPDLVLLFDLPETAAAENLRRRERETGGAADIHETDMDYLHACREASLQAAQTLGWSVLPVCRAGAMRPAEEIAEEVLRRVKGWIE